MDATGQIEGMLQRKGAWELNDQGERPRYRRRLILTRRLFPFFVSPTLLNLVVIIPRFVGQLLFAVPLMNIRFGARLGFISRSKIERIRPEDPKTIRSGDDWGQPNLKRLVKQRLGLLSDRERACLGVTMR